jgi:endonuclease YncB( thermonuclease family)
MRAKRAAARSAAVAVPLLRCVAAPRRPRGGLPEPLRDGTGLALSTFGRRRRPEEIEMRFPLALLAALTLALSASAARVRAEEPFYGPCRVQHVVDGDTADVRCGVEVARVRLLDVNAPERDQVGYTEAARGLQQLLAGRALWLAFAPPGRPTLDRDGRLLAHLYDSQARNLNVELVRLGWAEYDTSHGPGRFPVNFRAAENEARAGQRALWSVREVTAERR